MGAAARVPTWEKRAPSTLYSRRVLHDRRRRGPPDWRRRNLSDHPPIVEHLLRRLTKKVEEIDPSPPISTPKHENGGRLSPRRASNFHEPTPRIGSDLNPDLGAAKPLFHLQIRLCHPPEKWSCISIEPSTPSVTYSGSSSFPFPRS